jgi:hypothetical protein
MSCDFEAHQCYGGRQDCSPNYRSAMAGQKALPAVLECVPTIAAAMFTARNRLSRSTQACGMPKLPSVPRDRQMLERAKVTQREQASWHMELSRPRHTIRQVTSIATFFRSDALPHLGSCTFVELPFSTYRLFRIADKCRNCIDTSDTILRLIFFLTIKVSDLRPCLGSSLWSIDCLGLMCRKRSAQKRAVGSLPVHRLFGKGTAYVGDGDGHRR